MPLRAYNGSHDMNWTKFMAPTGSFMEGASHELCMNTCTKMIWHMTNRSSKRSESPNKNEITPINKASIAIPLNKFIRFLVSALYTAPLESRCKLSYLENSDTTGFNLKFLISFSPPAN